MVPVIAKVNGVAAGAGMNMAPHAILPSAATRRLAIARRGLSVDFGGTDSPS